MLINRSIPGQLREEEQFAIALLAKLVPINGTIIEVGSLLGRSSWIWAKNAHSSVTVNCIDPWEKTSGGNFKKLAGENNQTFSLRQFKINTADCHNVVALQGFSPADFRDWRGQIDLYFEDAVHTDPILSENLSFWGSRLKPSGILCGHDFVDNFPDVQRSAREAAAAMNRKLHVIGSLWFILPEELENPAEAKTAEIIAQLRELEGYEATLPKLNANESFLNYTKRIVAQIGAFDYRMTFDTRPVSVAMGEFITLTGTVTNISGNDWPVSALGTAFLKLGAELHCGPDRKKVAIDRFWFNTVILKNGQTVPFQISLNTDKAQMGPAELYVDLVYDHITWFERRGSGAQRLKIAIRPGLEFNNDIDHTLPVTNPRCWQQYVPEFNPCSELGIAVNSQQNYIIHTSRGDFPTKSMLTTYELAMLYSLARDYYSGEGEIVDLGTLLGVGTHVMARGVFANPKVANKTRRIFSHDLYLMENQSHFLPETDAGNTGSVFWRFLEINRDYLDLIVPSPGDVTKLHWKNAPIEILFIDLAKSWSTNAHLLKTHFRHLIPGKSVVIQQDYVHAPEPWVALTMELLREYFDKLYFVYGASAVYLLKKPIPTEVLETDLQQLSVARISQMFTTARNHATDAVAQVLKCCEAWILAERNEFEAASRLLDSVNPGARDGTDISRNFTPAIQSNLNVTRKQLDAFRRATRSEEFA